jgi:hypothetical protein
LTTTINNPPHSAYVEFRKVGDKCEIHVKVWNGGDATMGNNPSSLTRMRTHPAQNQLLTITGQVVVNVNSANLLRVHSQRLRG